MLVRMIAGSLALLAFSVATFAGIWAGNDLSTVLLRAWWALVLFLVLGAVIGWIAQIAIDEFLAKNHQQIVDQIQQGFMNNTPNVDSGKTPQPGAAMDTAGANHAGSNTPG